MPVSNMPRTNGARTLGAAVFLAICPLALADDARHWIAFDNSPAGTAPTVVLMPDQSSIDASTFKVVVHGMWSEDRIVPGTSDRLQALSLPGQHAPATNALGLPELPGIGLHLACTKHGANGEGAIERVVIEPVSQIALDGLVPWPAQPDDGIDRSDGSDGAFYYDADFYQQASEPFPLEDARLTSPPFKYRGVPSQACAATCMRSIPSQKRLIVDTTFICKVQFAGERADEVSLTPRAAVAFDMRYHNSILWWDLSLSRMNMAATEGDYLIVTANKYINELMPLIRQKIERGLHVTIVTTESLGAGFDATDVKDAIADWYGDCQNQFEAYVLLIGDVDEMPMHVDPLNALPSDHYYVCLDDELYPSCEIGRYSVDSESDLAEQISKTMTYSESPMLFSGHYKRSLLAAHEQESKNYVECIEDIEAATYWGVTPSFTMYSGREAGSTVANVVNDISNTHYGLVMYRGHGWQRKWSDWNIANEDLFESDVAGLANGDHTPIVVSVACGNSKIDQAEDLDDCIGEIWMEGSKNGAVAHIGSIRSSYTTPNHEFAKSFHKYYWSGYNTSLGEMMQDAWLSARLAVSDASRAEKNIYMSQLLGDPELRPWRTSPIGLRLETLPQFEAGQMDYQFELDLQDVPFDPSDVILVMVVNDEIRGMGRFSADGGLQLPAELDADDQVVIRLHTEVANSTDARYESDVQDETSCVEDLDGSGTVDVNDLLVMISMWATEAGDLDGDGTTNVNDLLVVLAAFGPCS
ncbi:MAG: C25 family cysteine peptidase [Phycisphaerales bacterium]|nr:C25 family cysteine peptidase [Phycisphaerales bacterium]